MKYLISIVKYSFLYCVVILIACNNHQNNAPTQNKPELQSEKNRQQKVNAQMTALTKNELNTSDVKHSNNTPFYLGTYTNGESQGIYKYQLDSKGIISQISLAASTTDPSFLAKTSDGKFLLAVNEVDSEAEQGTVESFKMVGDTLHFLDRKTSGGAHPCHISIDEFGHVLTSNYTGGNVGLLKINADGKLSDLLDLQQHHGKGTHFRQDKPHAHSAWFIPRSDEVVSVDLGNNELIFARIVAEGDKFLSSENNAVNGNTLKMAPGAGPRHLAFHPKKEWIYVVNELDATVTLLLKDESEKWSLQNSISTLPADWEGENTCADIHVSPDGRFLYVSNRGHNSIAIFTINQINGSLTSIGFENCRGEGPRNFAITPTGDYLLVANQLTNNIISFAVDMQKGTLTFVDEASAPTPVCVLF